MTHTLVATPEGAVIGVIGPIAVSAYRRPYRATDVDQFSAVFDQQHAQYGDAFGSFLVVDTRTWGKTELEMLTDGPTRERLSKMQDRFAGKGAATAVVLIGSGITV